VALLRADTTPLFPRLRAELTSLLAGLPGSDWERATACPGWSVQAVAAHLLGGRTRQRLGEARPLGTGPGRGEDLDSWLDVFNQQWVDAAQRISPALFIELLDMAGRCFEEHLATLDLDATGSPVNWATGSDPAPVWLDAAREYIERYVHPRRHGAPTAGPAFTSPVLITAAHALPRALDQVTRPPGTVVTFIAEGEGGGTWHVVWAATGWELEPAPRRGLPHAARVRRWTARSSSISVIRARRP